MQSLPSNCLLLVNPISGGRKAISHKNDVLLQLQTSGMNVRIHVSSSQDDLVAAIHDADEQLVFLLSGDGSLQSAAKAIINAKLPIVLAPLPAGRGNDFCARLGISKDINQAVAKILNNAESVSVDVIRINEDLLALGALSIGIDAAAAQISHQIQQRGNRWLKGAPLYVYSAFSALRSWQTAQISFSMDDGNVVSEGIWLFVVSNSGQFGGGMKISPNSALEDGVLEIILVGEVSKWDFMTTLPRVFSGKHMSHPKLKQYSVRKVDIAAATELAVFADGEPIGATPISASVLPRALKILK